MLISIKITYSFLKIRFAIRKVKQKSYRFRVNKMIEFQNHCCQFNDDYM